MFIVLPPWIVVEFSLHFLMVCSVEEEGSQPFRDQYQQLIVLICLLCTLFAILTDVQMLLMTAWGCGPTAKAQYLYSALSGLPQLGKKELLSPVDDELEPCAELEPGARRRYGFEPLGAIQAGSSLEARPDVARSG
ncbi:UNVERIFIED_ORG: hypothetical protein GGE44_000538 [Rhizobium esperanzae]